MTIDLRELDGVLGHIEDQVSPPPFEATLKAADQRRLAISRTAFVAVIVVFLLAVPSVLVLSAFGDRDTAVEVASEGVDSTTSSSISTTSTDDNRIQGDPAAIQIARESLRWAVTDWSPASEEDLIALQSEAASVRFVDHEGQSFFIVSAPCAPSRWEIFWQTTGFVVGAPIELDPDADTAAIECDAGLPTLEQLPVESGQFVALELADASDDATNLLMSVADVWSVSLWRETPQTSSTTVDSVTTTTVEDNAG